MPEIDYISVCTGSFDLLIEVVCLDNDHMLRVLEESVRTAPGVDSIETFTILDVPKHSYRWTRLLASRARPRERSGVFPETPSSFRIPEQSRPLD